MTSPADRDAGVGGDSDSDASRRIQKFPKAAVGRLSLYFRELHRLADQDVTRINSRELGKLVDVSPAIVRRDISLLGAIGQRGVGYKVSVLTEQIGAILGSGMTWRVVLIGVGSLGDALLRYRGFERLGFDVSAAYDTDPKKCDRQVGGIPIRNFESLQSDLHSKPPDLAIIAVPASAATEVASMLAGAGVSGILNFAPTTIRLSSSVAVVNVDLASELQRLAFAVQSNR